MRIGRKLPKKFKILELVKIKYMYYKNLPFKTNRNVFTKFMREFMHQIILIIK
jgi:hypothetical protein